MTFQARDVDESRYMYDQLAVLAPIMLAMTAASPIFKGRLADIDARWTVIAQVEFSHSIYNLLSTRLYISKSVTPGNEYP